MVDKGSLIGECWGKFAGVGERGLGKLMVCGKLSGLGRVDGGWKNSLVELTETGKWSELGELMELIELRK